MKAAKKSQKKAHKASRRKSYKKKRTGNKKKIVQQPMELSPIHSNGSPHNLEGSPNSIHFDDSPPQGSVHSFSNMASQLNSGPSPSPINVEHGSRNTTVESMDIDHNPGNDDTMNTDELAGPSPTNSSANTTRDRSSGGSKKRKRVSRRKR
jgi:hypothetical protein